MRRLTALALLVLAIGLAPPARAHEPTGGAAKQGYISTVTNIDPLVLGLEARVLGAQDKLFVRNWSRKRVVVFEQDGTALVLKPGASGSWHDHRIGWFSDEPPPLVRRDPDHVHLLRTWRIPGRAAGRPFVIKGFLGYAPPPGEKDGSGEWILPVALIGAALVAAGAGVGARRRWRRAP
jgi:hypothetical protein